MVQWLRLCAPKAGSPGTRFHMLQLRAHKLQLKILRVAVKTLQAATKTGHNQTEKKKKIEEEGKLLNKSYEACLTYTNR